MKLVKKKSNAKNRTEIAYCLHNVITKCEWPSVLQYVFENCPWDNLSFIYFFPHLVFRILEHLFFFYWNSNTLYSKQNVFVFMLTCHLVRMWLNLAFLMIPSFHVSLYIVRAKELCLFTCLSLIKITNQDMLWHNGYAFMCCRLRIRDPLTVLP